MALLGPFSNHPALDEAAHQMFQRFSRMEYALKATGYLVRANGNAEANWDRFAVDIDDDFQDAAKGDPNLAAAVTYLLEHPPKKQIARNGALMWSDEPPHATVRTALLLQYVRRVRNNLFHGGKFNGEWFEPERSELLLQHCLVILDGCRRTSQSVRDAHDH